MSVNCRIITDFERPEKELVEAFRNIPAANIDDVMGRIAAIDSAIKPVGKPQILGVAFTVKVPQGDNLMFNVAMDLAKPGDVILIDAGGFENRAIFGELMASYCKSRGINGIICDGAIRDKGYIASMADFPVYAKAATPNGPYKNGPGEINVPIVIGGKIVHPGDIIVGDDDGVVIVPQVEARSILEASLKIFEKEEGTKAAIREGRYEQAFVYEKLENINCEFIKYGD